MSRNREGKVVAAADDPRRAGDRARPIGGWFVEVVELTGYEKQAAELRDLVAGDGVQGDRR